MKNAISNSLICLLLSIWFLCLTGTEGGVSVVLAQDAPTDQAQITSPTALDPTNPDQEASDETESASILDNLDINPDLEIEIRKLTSPFKSQLPVIIPEVIPTENEHTPYQGLSTFPIPENAQVIIEEPPPPIIPPTFSISGIIWNSRRPQAIIDNEVVDIGDVIKDATIKTIKKTGIDIEYEGEIFTIDSNSKPLSTPIPVRNETHQH